ncbi:MAG: class IV adenylate cyclase [Desulfovibrio sp.]|nr:class IV adenylate cyclase [Desulfovibrio sp.]
MAFEVERKYLNVDFAELRAHLEQKAALALGRHFERNVLYETDPPSLFAQKKLLRLRSCFQAGQAARFFLTFKAPAPAQAEVCGCKVRLEEEVQVSSGQTMDAILRGQGFIAWACYEKVREAWQAGELSVVLDVLPFGRFVELEGEASAIEAWARDLGLSQCEQSTQSYHALHQDWLRNNGRCGETSFVFSEQERQHWIERLGLCDLAPLPQVFAQSQESCLNAGAGV